MWRIASQSESKKQLKRSMLIPSLTLRPTGAERLWHTRGDPSDFETTVSGELRKCCVGGSANGPRIVPFRSRFSSSESTAASSSSVSAGVGPMRRWRRPTNPMSSPKMRPWRVRSASSWSGNSLRSKNQTFVSKACGLQPRVVNVVARLRDCEADAYTAKKVRRSTVLTYIRIILAVARNTDRGTRPICPKTWATDKRCPQDFGFSPDWRQTLG